MDKRYTVSSDEKVCKIRVQDRFVNWKTRPKPAATHHSRLISWNSNANKIHMPCFGLEGLNGMWIFNFLYSNFLYC